MRRCQMRGRDVDGWLRVDDEALHTDDDLRRWVDLGVAYVRSLPEQPPPGGGPT